MHKYHYCKSDMYVMLGIAISYIHIYIYLYIYIYIVYTITPAQIKDLNDVIAGLQWPIKCNRISMYMVHFVHFLFKLYRNALIT